MRKILSFIFVGFLTLSVSVYVNAQHDHKEGEHHEEEHNESCSGTSADGVCTPESLKKSDKADKHEHKAGEHDDHAEAKGKDEHGHEEEGHGDEHGEASASVGPGKAVIEIKNEGQALKLSPQAQAKIKIEFAQVSRQGELFVIPKSALLEYQASTAIYRLSQDGFIELTPVTVIKRDTKQVTVKAALSSFEKIVVRGVPLLRAAQLEASGQGGEGHAH